jgi:uncharacterized phage protein gp47/JayE
MNGNGNGRVDYTAKDFDALLDGMLELARQRLPEWTDQSENDPGTVILELVANAIDVQLYYVDRLFNESFLDTAVEDRSLVNLLRLIGYELRAPQPASADLTLLFDKTGSGTVTIPTGARFETSAKITGKPVPFQYVRAALPITLDSLPLGTVDRVEYKVFSGLPVTQVDASAANEVLGSSDGTAGQRFRLARTPLIEGSLTVYVDEGAGPRPYDVRPSLLDSGPADRAVTVRRDERDVAWIEFGNNKYGVIPPRLRNNITATYRVGGGVKGNVVGSSIVTAVTSITSLKKVYNPLAATGGTDRQVIAEAVERAPRQFRSMGRAVTADDYESHALQFGVGKARARAAGWNNIELYVAPVGGGFPSDTLKADLSAYFESRRILTSLLDLRDPVYVNVDVRGMLFIEPYFFTQEVVTSVTNAVNGVLAFDNVDFADTLFLSKLYESIEAVEGVQAVTITRFQRADVASPDIATDGRIVLGWDEIPVPSFAEGIALTSVTGGAL